MNINSEYQWIIVGGGLQGSYFAALLSHHYGHKQVAILDPQPRLLHRWLQRSSACRMKYMRSTSVHHLAPNPSDLLDFAQIRGYGSQHFATPYLRPSLALFNAHSQEVLHGFALQDLQIRGELYALRRESKCWRLEYQLPTQAAKSSLYSQNVLLALGDQGEYYGEDWEQDHKSSKSTKVSPIWHLSAMDFSLETVLNEVHKRREASQAPRQSESTADICLVGGGISSAQLALHLLESEDLDLQIQIHSRYPLRSFQFDSEPGWLLKFLPKFQAEEDLDKRWQMICKERHKGSVPPQLYQKLQHYWQSGQLQLEDKLVEQATPPKIPTILATGLCYICPNWLLQVAQQLDLPLLDSEQGPKPALRSSLEWDAQKAPGLYLAGRLAELFLGPAAGNIAGARIAARYLPVQLEHPGSFLA